MIRKIPALPLIYDLNQFQLSEQLKQWEQPGFRLKQVWQGLYQKLWDDPQQFTALPANLREILNRQYSFSHLRVDKIIRSRDALTTKVLFRLPDQHPVETVLMRYDKRNTLCISTQSGCAMGCVFCATGQLGFLKNLSSGEIVEQVLFFARLLASEGTHLTNIVIMGMGEPFHNMDATLQSIERLNDPSGFGMGERRFTISTVGLVPQIIQFARQRLQVNLAISLHAANDDLRSRLLPINRQYPLNELMEACQEYFELTHRRISFEWALIEDVNDSEADARQLAELIKGLICHVNIILLNPTHGYSGNPTTRQRANAFQQVIESSGIPCTIRLRRGIEIHAGCGQLAGESNHENDCNCIN